MKRNKRKPPKGARCDATIGADYSRHAPTIKRCTEMATVEMKGGPFGHEAWFCEDCAKAIEEGEKDA